MNHQRSTTGYSSLLNPSAQPPTSKHSPQPANKKTMIMSTPRKNLAKVTLALLVTSGILGSGSVKAANDVWTNNTANSLLNSALWSNGVTPVSGDGWIFANTTGVALSNNFASGFSVGGITFATNAGADTIGNGTLTLTGGITNNSSNNQTFGAALIINSNVTFTNGAGSTGSSYITLNGNVSGTGTITYGATNTTSRLVIQNGTWTNFTGGVIFGPIGRININATSVSAAADYVVNATNGGVYLASAGISIYNIGSLSGSGVIQNNGGTSTNTLNVGFNNKSTTWSGNLSSNTGGLMHFAKSGTGTTSFTGTNTYTGTTTVSNGVLALGNGGATGKIANSTNITVSGPGVFAVNRNNAVSQGTDFTANAIIGTGGFAQIGTGTTTLNAVNTYTGATTVSAGTLALSSAGTIANSTQIVVNGTLDLTAKASGFTLNNGQSLGGSGTVTTVAGQSVSLASGSTLSPGNSPGNLTVSSLILNGGANYNWQVADATGSAGVGYDTATVGTLNLSNLSSGNKFNVNLWTLSSTTATNGNAQNFNTASSFSWTLASYTNLTGTFDASLFNINTAATNGTAGFANSFAGNFAIVNSNNSLVLTYTGGTAPNSWTNGSGNLSSISLVTTTNLTFAGPGGLVTNDNAASAFTGIVFSSDASGSYTFSGSALSNGVNGIVNSSLSAQTVSLPLTLTAAQSFNAASAALTVSGNVDNGGNQLTLAGNSALVVSGNVSGAGNLVKSGANTTTLSGNNSYSGGTALNAGTLVISGSSAIGTGDLTNSGNNSLVVSSSATLGNNVVLYSGVLTLNDNGNAVTENGSISGSGSLTKAGVGTVTLSGNNSYGGVTTVNGGTLALNGANSTTGATTVNSSGTLKVGNASALGSGALSVNSGGLLDLGGYNLTYASIAGTGRLSNSTGASTLTLGDAGTTTFAGSLVDGGGTLALNKTAAGTVILTGSSTASGGAVVNGGTLVLTNGSSFGSAITTATGTTLKAYGTTLTGATIGGNGNTSTGGAGTANFTATNSTLNGAVVISGPSQAGTIAYGGPNNASGSVGTNYGYAQFSSGVTATNLTVNGRLDIATGTYNLSGITGTSNNLQTAYVGGGSGAIVYNSTTSNNLSFVAGGAFSGFFLNTNAVASLSQSGSGTTSFGIFGQPAGNTVAATNSVVSFNGGNWAIGQFGQNNGFQIFAGTANLINGAAITVGGNTGAGTTGYTHGNFNVSNGSLTFNGNTAQSGGGAAALANTLNFNVGSSGTLTINGTLQLGVNASSAGTVVNPSSLVLNGGRATMTGLYLGQALNSSNAIVNDVINATVNSGILNVGASGITVGYNSVSGLVSNEQATLTLAGGKILSAGAIGAPTVLAPGSTIISSFIWTGGQLSALTVSANNANWNGAGSSITGNTLYNSNGVLSPGDIGTAGLTTINGNYVQGAGGTLSLDVLGSTVANAFQMTNGNAYDRLTVNGNNTLGGTLNVAIGNGVNIATNALGTSYTLVSATTNTGSYATINLAGLSGTNGITGSASNSYGTYTTYMTTNGYGVDALVISGNSIALSYLANAWQGGTGTNWGSAGTAAWSAGIAPSGNNFTAYFGSTGSRSVNLDQNVTVGGMIFSNTSGYTLSSTNGSVLTLDGSYYGGTATIANQTNGTQVISNAVVLNTALKVANATSSGTVIFGGGVTGPGSITVDSGTFGLSNSVGTTTVSNNISGAGSLGIYGSGSGAVVLAGSNSFTGSLTLNSGTTVLSSRDAIGNGSIYWTAAGLQSLVDLSGANAITNAVTIGSGFASASGTNNITLAGAVTETGGNRGLAGNLSNGAVLTISGPVYLSESTGATARTLTLQGSGNTVVSGAISDYNGGNNGSSLTKAGTGTLTLSGNNTYTGGTTLSGGLLNMSGASALGTGFVKVSGGILALGGNVISNDTQAVTLASGTITGGTITGSGDFNGFSNGTLSANLSGTGNLNKNGTGSLVLGGTDTVGNTEIYAGKVNVTGSLNSAFIGVGDPGTNAALLVSSGGSVTVTTSGLAIGNTAPSSGNSVTVTDAGSSLYVTGGVQVGNDANVSSNSFKVANGATASVDSVTVGNFAGDSANSVLVTGTGSVLTVSGQLNLGSDASTGNSVSVSSNAVLNTADAVIGGNGTGGASSNSSVLVTSGAAWNVNGALTLGDGSSGNSLTVSGAGTVTVSGMTVSGTDSLASGTSGSNNSVLVTGTGSVLTSVGSLTIGDTGSGSLTVGGGATLNAPVLYLANGASSSATLNVGTLGGKDTGVNLNVGSINFGTAGGTAAVNFSQADSLTLASTISGNGAINQLGSGSTILTGYQGATGAITIARGTLQYGDGSTNATGFVSTTGGNGTISNNGTLAFAQYNDLTVESVISGSGSVAQIASGTTILTGDNTYSGTTLVSGGTLQVGNGGTTGSLGSGSLTLANSATLVFNRSDSLSLGNSIGGIGNVTYLGGSYTNGAASTYNGFTTVDGGANVTLGSVNANGSGRFVVGLTGGNNSLNFTGAAVSSVDSMQVGGSNTSSGNGVQVSGATVNLTHTLGVGALGSSDNSLQIANGGSVSSGNLYVGAGSGTNNSIVVAGNGSSLTADGGSVGNFVGAGSSGNWLNVNNGASLNTLGNFYIGNNGGLNNSVSIDNATWNNSQIVNVDGGALNVGANAAVTSGSVNLGSSNAQLNFNQAGTTNTLSAGITGTEGSVNVNGGGTTILTGTGYYSGTTTVAKGSTLQFGNGLSSGTIGATSIQNSGFVKFNNAGTTTFSGQISGNGSVGQSGGTTILTGNNSFSGTTTIASASALQVGNGGSTGALGSGDVVNDGSLLFNRVDALTQSGAISGLGSVTKNGYGELSLLGENSYTGSTTINSGSINLGTTGKLSGTSGITVANGATLLLGSANQVNTASDLTLGGTLNMGAGSSKASQAFNSLTLTANSIIDFSALSGVSQLSFGSINLGGKSLSVYNWNGGSSWYPTTSGDANSYTYLNLDGGSSALTNGSLSNISFYSGGAGSSFLGTGQFAGNQIVPVPEPGVVLAALMLLGCLLFGNRRMLALLIPVRR